MYSDINFIFLLFQIEIQFFLPGFLMNLHFFLAVLALPGLVILSGHGKMLAVYMWQFTLISLDWRYCFSFHWSLNGKLLWNLQYQFVYCITNSTIPVTSGLSDSEQPQNSLQSSLQYKKKHLQILLDLQLVTQRQFEVVINP